MNLTTQHSHQPRHAARLALALAGILSLASCGDQIKLPSVAPTAAPSARVPNATELQALAMIGSEEQQVIDYLNELRSQGTIDGKREPVAQSCMASISGLGKVSPLAAVQLAAENHALYSSIEGYEAHTEKKESPYRTGNTSQERTDHAAQQLQVAGAGAGYFSALDMTLAWLASPAHCANLANPTIDSVGVALVTPRGGAENRNIWIMVVGEAK